MNINYLKALDKLNFAKSDIEKLWNEADEASSISFEDKEAYFIIENIIERIDTAVHQLKRLSLPAIEGKLQEDTVHEKFELIRKDNGQGLGRFFNCGDYLEVYDQETGEWQTGRVEHTTRNGQSGYYFYNNYMVNPFLYTGMKARVRNDCD